jgi:hypothetical protein
MKRLFRFRPAPFSSRDSVDLALDFPTRSNAVNDRSHLRLAARFLEQGGDVGILTGVQAWLKYKAQSSIRRGPFNQCEVEHVTFYGRVALI